MPRVLASTRPRVCFLLQSAALCPRIFAHLFCFSAFRAFASRAPRLRVLVSLRHFSEFLYVPGCGLASPRPCIFSSSPILFLILIFMAATSRPHLLGEDAGMHICTHALMHTCTYAHIYCAHMHTCTYTHAHAHASIHMRIHIRISIHVHIYTYIHTSVEPVHTMRRAKLALSNNGSSREVDLVIQFESLNLVRQTWSEFELY